MEFQIDKIIAYENGELTNYETVQLFSELLKSGIVWKLQGHYGRTAQMLIKSEYLNLDGLINEDNLQYL